MNESITIFELKPILSVQVTLLVFTALDDDPPFAAITPPPERMAIYVSPPPEDSGKKRTVVEKVHIPARRMLKPVPAPLAKGTTNDDACDAFGNQIVVPVVLGMF